MFRAARRHRLEAVGMVVTSALVVLAWGYFLYQGVIDPLGGINSLWPLFGISNQLLSAIALCVGTTVILKMHGATYIWITLAPLCVAGDRDVHGRLREDIFAGPAALDFWRMRPLLNTALAAGKVAAAKVAETQAVIFNERLDAVVCGEFLMLVLIILFDSVRVW